MGRDSVCREPRAHHSVLAQTRRDGIGWGHPTRKATKAVLARPWDAERASLPASAIRPLDHGVGSHFGGRWCTTLDRGQGGGPTGGFRRASETRACRER